jgi:hypothetical protein
VDPYTRGALRERMKLVGSAVHLRSFLDPAKVPGHTIKGSGLVSFRANRFNTTIQPMDYHLERAINKHIQSLGVQSSDYNFGPIKVLAPTVGISINGRRYKNLNMHIKYHRIFCFVTKILAIPQITTNISSCVHLILTYSVYLQNILVIFTLYM